MDTPGQVPGKAPSKALVLSDGGLVSLVACAVAREAAPPGRKDLNPIVVPWRCEGSSAEFRRRAAQQQAELLGLRFLEKWKAPQAPNYDAAKGPVPEESESLGLVAAVHLATRLKCTSVIWPAHGVIPGANHDPAAGLDLDLIAHSYDRAVLASRLGSLDTGALVGVETPYLDLSDRQVADLAADMELPLDACWWWGTPHTYEPAARERTRWYRAFESAGWSSMVPSTESTPIHEAPIS